ncbi:YbaK/EbsC family protein [Alphaproteobacteria bacterium KMM 3653]|uniref:YbaK/EbsC family protein n=1 Tax=Harenicola maris TaxID=2841044 RepID=A0AAP2G7C1_9RHOB|nr:YbaK/EbsC family protein [Harenicola maris]
MSKSLKRVETALSAAGVDYDLREMPGETRTAAQAAEAAGCHIDQIAKSILMAGQGSGDLTLFITPGGHLVDEAMAEALTGEAMTRPDANRVRTVTGFAVGGVAPVGHKTPIAVYFDRVLEGFDVIWAAAGTPRHIFAIAPQVLCDISGAKTANFSVTPKA